MKQLRNILTPLDMISAQWNWMREKDILKLKQLLVRNLYTLTEYI